MAKYPVGPVVEAVSSALHHLKVPTSRTGVANLFRELLGERVAEETSRDLDVALRRQNKRPAPEPMTADQKADMVAQMRAEAKPAVTLKPGGSTSELRQEARKAEWLGTVLEKERLSGEEGRGADANIDTRTIAKARSAASAERARRRGEVYDASADDVDTEVTGENIPATARRKELPSWRETRAQAKAAEGLSAEQAGTTEQVLSDNLIRDLKSGKTRGHLVPLEEAKNYKPGDKIRLFDEVTGEEHVGEIAVVHPLSKGSKYTIAGSNPQGWKKAKGARAKTATENPLWYGWPQEPTDPTLIGDATFRTKTRLTPEEQSAAALEEEAANVAGHTGELFRTGTTEKPGAGRKTKTYARGGEQPRRMVQPDERESYTRIAAATGYPTDLIYRLSRVQGPGEHVYLEFKTQKRPSPVKKTEIPLSATGPGKAATSRTVVDEQGNLVPFESPAVTPAPLHAGTRAQREQANKVTNQLSTLDPGEPIVQAEHISGLTPTTGKGTKTKGAKARAEREGGIRPPLAEGKVPRSAESGVVPAGGTARDLVGQTITLNGRVYKVVHAEPSEPTSFKVERDLPSTTEKDVRAVLPGKRQQYPGTTLEKQWNAARLTGQNVILEGPKGERLSLFRSIYPYEPEEWVKKGYSLLPPTSTKLIPGNPGAHIVGVRPNPDGSGSLLITQPLADVPALKLTSGRALALPRDPKTGKYLYDGRLQEIQASPEQFAELTQGLTRPRKGGNLNVLTTGFEGAGSAGFYGGKVAGIPHHAYALGGGGTPLFNKDGTPLIDPKTGKQAIKPSDATRLGVKETMVAKGAFGAKSVTALRDKVVDDSDGVILITTLTDGKGRPRYQVGDKETQEEWHGSDAHFGWVRAADQKKPVYVIDVTRPETLDPGKIAHWAYINDVDTIGVVGSPLAQLETVLGEGTQEARVHLRDTLGKAFSLLKRSRAQTDALIKPEGPLTAPTLSTVGRGGMDLVGKEPNQTFAVNPNVRGIISETDAQRAKVIPARLVTGSLDTGYTIARTIPIPEGRTAIVAEGVDPTVGGHPVTKIISGFQDGVDITGIRVGQALGYEVGGFAPKGFVTSTGTKPEYAQQYGAIEHQGGKISSKAGDNQFKADLRDRTAANVQAADGTVWFGAQSPGWYITREASKGKPFLENPKSADELKNWLIKHNIKTLNVAGNRPNLDVRGQVRTANDPLASQNAERILTEALGPRQAATQNVAAQAAGGPAIEAFQGAHRFLSNFHPAPVVLDGVTYPTVEHAYQAAKTTDPRVRQKIAESPTPGQAKKNGQKVPLRPDWEQVRLPIMKDLLEQKFANPELRTKLDATGQSPLTEGNAWGDTFWGVSGGKGENHLGKLLMEVRGTQAASAPAKTTAPVTAEVKGYVPFDKLKALSERLKDPNLTAPEVMDIKSDMRAVLARDAFLLTAPGKGDVSGMRGPKGEAMHDVAPGVPGWLGNPYKWRGNGGPKTVGVNEVIAQFEEDFHKKIASDPAFREAVLAIRGKKVEYYKWETENNHLKVVRDWLLMQPVTPPVRTPGGSRQVLVTTGPWDEKTRTQQLIPAAVRRVTYDADGKVIAEPWVYDVDQAGVPSGIGQLGISARGGRQSLLEGPQEAGTSALVRQSESGFPIPAGSEGAEGTQATIDVMPAESGLVGHQDRQRILRALEDGTISPRIMEILESKGIIHPSDQVESLASLGFELPDARPSPRPAGMLVPSIERSALPGTTQAPDVVPPPLGATRGVPFELGMRPSQLTGSTPPGPHIPVAALATPGPHVQALGLPLPRMDERLVDIPVVGGPSPAGALGPARLGTPDTVEVGRGGRLGRLAPPEIAAAPEAPPAPGAPRLVKDPAAAWARKLTALILAGASSAEIAKYMQQPAEEQDAYQEGPPDLSGIQVSTGGLNTEALARMLEPIFLRMKGRIVRPRITDPISPTLTEPYRTEQIMRNAPQVEETRLSPIGGIAEALVDNRQLIKEYNEDWNRRSLAETGEEVPAEIRSDKQMDLEMGGGGAYEEVRRKEAMGDVLSQIWKQDLSSDLDGYLSANITTRSLNSLDRAEQELEDAALQSRLYGRSGSSARAEAKRIRELPPDQRAPMGATRDQADAARAEIRGRRTPEEMALIDRAVDGLDTYVGMMLRDGAEAGLLDKATVERILAIQDPYARIKYIRQAFYNEDGTPAGDLMTVLRQRRIDQLEQKGGKLSVTEEAVVKYLKGANLAKRPTQSPVEATITSMEEMGKEIARNKAAKSLTYNLRGDPLANLRLNADNEITNRNGWIADITDRDMPALPQGYSTVSYMENGEARRLMVPQEIADAVSISTANSVASSIWMLRKSRGLLQTLATSANLGFLLKNLPRDVVEAFLLTPGLGIRDVPAFGRFWGRMFVDSLNDNLSPLRREFMLARAGQANLTANINPRLHAYQVPTRNPLTRIVRGTQGFLNATEEATKGATYGVLRSKGISQDQAAWWTRNFGGSPDFAKRGRLSPAMAEWVMFFNPQIQGTARTIAAYRTDPWKLVEHMAGFTAAALALDMYNRSWINPDTGRPDIEDVPEDQQKANLIIMNGTAARETNSLGKSFQPYVRLSLPHAAQLLYTPILSAIRMVRGDPSASLGEAVGDTLSNVLPGSLKFDPRHPYRSTLLSGLAAVNPVPKVIGELGWDVNAMTGTPIEGRRETSGLPSERWNERSSPFFREVHRALPGIPWSPLQTEHVFRSFLPGLGEIGLSLADAAVRTGEPQAPRVQSTDEALIKIPGAGPIGRSFLSTTGSQVREDLANRLFDTYGKVQQAVTSLNEQQQSRAPDRLEQIARIQGQGPINAHARALSIQLTYYVRSMSQIASERQHIQESAIPLPQKEAALRKLWQREYSTLKAANTTLDRAGVP